MSRVRGPAAADRIRAARAARAAGLFFALSAASSIGLGITYWLGGQVQAEGALLAGALGGIGLAFILWAHHLMPRGPFVGEREPLASSPADRDAFERDLERGEEGIRRRTFLGRMLGLSVGALGLAALFPIRSLGPGPGRSLFRTSWRRGSRLVTDAGAPVRLEDLDVGSFLTVYPEGHAGSADAQTVLIRLAPGELSPPPGREDWAPEGYVAYSKICTHAGCPVGLYEERVNLLFCPCHQSVFDVLRGAKPLAGPATRPLPQLPLRVDAGGYLIARDDFGEPVGPGFWNAP